jgi:HAD superfamily hydrolase (TIGR01549 family)
MSKRVKNILLSFGIPKDDLTDRHQVYRFILGWESAFIDYCFESKELDKVLDEMNEAINEVEFNAVQYVKRMTNAYGTLKKIKEMGLKIGIATRGSHLYSIQSLEITGLDRFVDFLLARDQVKFPKPDPRHLLSVIKKLKVDPNETIYVGDTVTDYTTALKASVRFYAYKRDERRVKRLIDAGCVSFIQDLYEIIRIIEQRVE